MILALERSSFNYLYKYNQIKINPNSLMELSGESLQMIRDEEVIRQLERTLPIFEEDHELLLLELDKGAIEYNGFLTVKYSGVIRIYPLTTVGGQLLEGRLNQNIDVDRPVFERYISELKVNRSLETRLLAAKTLHSAFSLPTKIKNADFNAIRGSVIAILQNSKPEKHRFIHTLIDYTLTPSYVPEGNLEYLIKVGMVAIKAMDKDESKIVLGPFYNVSIRELNNTLGKPLSETYDRFWKIKDSDFKSSANGVAQQAKTEFNNVDMFKVAYYFIAFRKMLQKNGHDLIKLGSEIKALVREDELVASWVLTLLGFSFSFENLYESLHKLDHTLRLEDKISVLPKKQYEKKAPKELVVGESYELNPTLTAQMTDVVADVKNTPNFVEDEGKVIGSEVVAEIPAIRDIPETMTHISETVDNRTALAIENAESSASEPSVGQTTGQTKYDGFEVKLEESSPKSAMIMVNFHQLMIEANTEYPNKNAKKYLKALKDHFSIETDISEQDFDAFEIKYEKIKHENLSAFIHNMFHR